MDFAQIAVTTGGIALMGLTLWFFLGKQAKKQAAGGEALYACPMHPWITSSDPAAECSICGMKLTRSDSK